MFNVENKFGNPNITSFGYNIMALKKWLLIVLSMQFDYDLGVTFSTALFRLVISEFAFLIKSPMFSLVGTAAPSDNAKAF